MLGLYLMTLKRPVHHIPALYKTGVQAPVTSCQVLEEVVQVSGRPTAPAKVEVWVAGQLSVCCAARLDALSLLGVGVRAKVEAEEAAGQHLQVLL